MGPTLCPVLDQGRGFTLNLSEEVLVLVTHAQKEKRGKKSCTNKMRRLDQMMFKIPSRSECLRFSKKGMFCFSHHLYIFFLEETSVSPPDFILCLLFLSNTVHLESVFKSQETST